ncbi:MAG: nucleotide sugar dehydrogenase [Alphaproteobacteria bacterium]|jgi:UDP-N-acetyl-D-galactosamine dehydrogenase|nr:UDP-N-acetyl-D-galactosamine dehydrogenase [Rhodospirillaceae bacterium]MDP6021280.1 nucleotide sugar dehydrogenase [Alphaproteobacteria bacterium]MDP6253571.1 nucleotide sugar dehydrogenase [Alphaproteobacteria bacterium]MDP7054015.1 nucleotide sugar dehydrogenase [Alphaproteobacteria bacterium]MDP7227326.1 nucleotide sugar dehydrogenase [Alphaproteobacteria bacterium]|tara:strand:+ start:6264 stop:7541 length:1278 start_codon:yes stop_codon:yes gene_type:complete
MTGSKSTTPIAVIGLGYVGLPLAVALARHFPTIGYDVDAARIDELRQGHDRTGEIDADVVTESTLSVTDDGAAIANAEVYIVTVPTPVDADNQPDLRLIRAACAGVGKLLTAGNIVVFESTVYPGVTEDICGPALAAASGLVCGQDFFLGYSPERINPGDREHTVDKITKVVAGQTAEVLDCLAALYGRVTAGGIHRAKDIKTAEAAKVIENAQRDINIAFVNEVAVICQKLDISAHDVLEAAGTKWNFLPFTPGLVGGHCIGVDPFYLAFQAQQLGHDPQIILSGRRLNDAMGDFVAACIDENMSGPGRVLLLGLTFKENVPDLRNTKVIDVVTGLTARGHQVVVHDPVADGAEAERLYGFPLLSSLDGQEGFDAVVGAVRHDGYLALTAADLAGIVREDGLIADIKGLWREMERPAGRHYWQL